MGGEGSDPFNMSTVQGRGERSIAQASTGTLQKENGKKKNLEGRIRQKKGTRKETSGKKNFTSPLGGGERLMEKGVICEVVLQGGIGGQDNGNFLGV